MALERNSLCTVRVGYLQLLLQSLTNHGLDPARIYPAALLAELSTLDPHAHRPVEEWDHMVQLAEQHAGDVDIALKMAEFVKPWDTGPVGFITMACRTLREGIEALGQFYSLLNDVYTLDGHADADHFMIEMIPQGPIQSARLERLTLATIAWHARWLSRRPDLVFNVAFTFEAPSSPERVLVYQRTFGGQVSFGSDRSRMTGPADYAHYPVARSPHSDAVHDVLRAQLMAQMALLHESSDSFVHKLERVLQPRLETGQVGLEDVAADMGISSRTLQNRLEESGLSYRSLLDRMRYAQAQVYLQDPEITLIQMTQMLGFATQSTFHRAFKRWAGVAPGEYRRLKLRPVAH